MPREDELWERLRTLEQAERECENERKELRRVIDRLASEAMIEAEVNRRIHRRDRIRIDWTLKALGTVVVGLQLYMVVFGR